jgi:DNA polymerase-3 subunit epsilon
MKGGRIDLGKTFYRLINPAAEMDGKSIVIHGITPSDVEEKPALEEVISEFVDFCKDAVIVGHFVSLDMSFINREMKRVYGKQMDANVIDTCSLYEWVKAGESGFSGHYRTDRREVDLFSLAREYSIPVNGAHNALTDALITAQLFQRFFKPLRDLGVRSLKDLFRIGRP